MKHLIKLLAFAVLTPLFNITSVAQTEPLYTQQGTDPTFAELLTKLPQGFNSTTGVTGSVIHVNQRLIEVGTNANHPIAKDIAIHTLGNSHVPRNDFPKWSRWYQEDDHTEIFRLFKGETNVRNGRPLAARVEAFSKLSWQTGGWHEWSGTFTVVKPGGAAIFQVMNNKNQWALHLDMNDKGDIEFDPRHNPSEKKIIATNMIGKPFDIRVRDNGLDYELYLNDKKVGSGSYPRPEGSKTGFRWGMYKGESTVNVDQMIFVTGATFH
jgi:hypothetical protein